MSRYSGRCDLYDTIQIQGGFDNIKNYTIYVNNESKPLKINTIKDLEPYYSYELAYGGFDNIKHTGTIYLIK